MSSSRKLQIGDKLKCIQATPDYWFDKLIPGNVYQIKCINAYGDISIVGETNLHKSPDLQTSLTFHEENWEAWFNKVSSITLTREYVNVKLP